MSTAFVGREQELNTITGLFRAVESSHLPSCVTITGVGGIGKTKLLIEAQHIAQNQGFIPSGIIDLGTADSKSNIQILRQIATTEGFTQSYFAPFYQALSEFESARDIEKFSWYRKLVSIFVESCKLQSYDCPVAILVDTYEAAQGVFRETKIQELLSSLQGTIAVIVAGRKPIQASLPLHANLQLQTFTLEETGKLATTIFADRHLDYDLEPQTLDLLYQRALGLPILICLAVDWIIEYAQPEAALRHEIEAMSDRQFEQKMVLDLRKLKDEETQMILYMASANLRFTPQIAHILTGNPNSVRVCEQLTRLSFIKHRVDAAGKVFVLHDEMLRLVREYVDYPVDFKNRIRRRLVTDFYDREIPLLAEPYLRQTLLGEKIYYLAHYDETAAIRLFNTQIRTLVAEYDFDSAHQLLEQIRSAPLAQDASNWVQLGEAEMLLKQYRPSDAKLLLDNLYEGLLPSADAEYRCRVLAGIAAYITNPCTSVEADLFEAIPYWERSLGIARETNLVGLEPEILYGLALTHVLVGQHNQALAVFEKALNLARDQRNRRLEARVLDELGKLYRIMQDLEKARPSIEESIAIRRAIGDDKYLGLSIYYLGNLYRDLDRFPEAIEHYELASQLLNDVGDVSALCELYSDMSWCFVLGGEWEKAAYYNQLSQELAREHGFGRELSEALHILYHLEMEKGNYDLAQQYVNEAYQVSRRYLNVYMVLDCLMHIAQDAYIRGECDRIPHILQEMLELETQGCGIRVFRGRTRMVYGDYYYDVEDYHNALAQWKEGLREIALYGNSRTNIELFEDYVSAREDKLRAVLRVLGAETTMSLSQYWDAMVLQSGYDYPQIIEICNSL